MKPTQLIFLYPNAMRLKTNFSIIFSGLNNLNKKEIDALRK